MPRTGAQRLSTTEHVADRVVVPLTRPRGLVAFLRALRAQARKNHLPAYAGSVAFRGLLALFPVLVSLLWLLTLVDAPTLVDALTRVVSAALPEAAAQPLRDQLASLPASAARGPRTLGVVVSGLVTLWALTGACGTTMDALNAMYAVEDSRSFWQRTATALLLSVTVGLLLVSALVLVVFGADVATGLAAATGQGQVFRWAWGIASWPVLVAAVLIAFTLVYAWAPDVEQRFRWVSVGAVVAVLLWLLFTLLFSLYISQSRLYHQAYGALAGIAVLMIYVYGVAYVLLLGAEINQLIEMRHPDGKNEGDKHYPAAPPEHGHG